MILRCSLKSEKYWLLGMLGAPRWDSRKTLLSRHGKEPGDSVSAEGERTVTSIRRAVKSWYGRREARKVAVDGRHTTLLLVVVMSFQIARFSAQIVVA